MENVEVQNLKDDVTEIKSDVKGVATQLQALQVLIAGSYVTRKEFEKYKKDEQSSRRWWAGFILAVASALAAIIRTIKF